MTVYVGAIRFSEGWTDPRNLFDFGLPDRYAPRPGKVLHVFADDDCEEWVIWHDEKTGRTYTEEAW